MREILHSQWTDIYNAFPKWRAQPADPSGLMPQSVSQSHFIYLTLPLQTWCPDVQFDISPSNIQCVRKREKSGLAEFLFPNQSLKLNKVSLVCLLQLHLCFEIFLPGSVRKPNGLLMWLQLYVDKVMENWFTHYHLPFLIIHLQSISLKKNHFDSLQLILIIIIITNRWILLLFLSFFFLYLIWDDL